jgi:hypothetical protein
LVYSSGVSATISLTIQIAERIGVTSSNQFVNSIQHRMIDIVVLAIQILFAFVAALILVKYYQVILCSFSLCTFLGFSSFLGKLFFKITLREVFS